MVVELKLSFFPKLSFFLDFGKNSKKREKMYGRIWFLLTFAALDKNGDILMKVSAIRIFTFVVTMGLSLCVMAQNTNQENLTEITNADSGDGFKLVLAFKDKDGSTKLKGLSLEDNKTFIIDLNGMKYTAFIDEILGGFGLYHNKQEVDAIDAARSDVILLLAVARNTGDKYELSAQDIKDIPEGAWGIYDVKNGNVPSGWVQKVITMPDSRQVILTVEDK